jgi:hypothetical protein
MRVELERFGHWTVLESTGRYRRCRCVCGTERVIRYSHVRNGNSKSCGCRGRPPVHVGQRHGQWTVLEKSGYGYLCRCSCGTERVVASADLSWGRSKSCGCINNRSPKLGPKEQHGMSSSPEFNVWRSMLNRCRVPTNKVYQHYGGRGISVCDRWTSFEAFFEDMGPRPSAKHTIERIDNNGNYCPENCQWVTMQVQQNNRRNNVRLTLQGRTQTQTQWSMELGIPLSTIRHRKKKGMSDEDALKVKR